MSEKRFVYHEEYFPLNVREIIDNEAGKTYNCEDATDVLNELFDENEQLKAENEQLRKIGVVYQGHNPCSNCTYCLENKVCCGIHPPILCDEMKKNFVYGLCKKHKQIQKIY